MADPLSVIAGVAGIANAALQSSKALSELINDIKGCSEEIKAVSRDVHAFHSITYSLNVILKEEAVRDAIGGDQAIVEMIRNLSGPLSNCQAVLGELMLKVQTQLRADSDGKRSRMGSANLKWGMFTKGDVRTLRYSLALKQRRLPSTAH